MLYRLAVVYVRRNRAGTVCHAAHSARTTAGAPEDKEQAEALPDELLRDDPPSPRPCRLFRSDAEVFRRTLLRLLAARDPWLREVLENLTTYVRTGLF
ncbi:hypothetical protein GCM10010424_63410 [Streptomyces lienomycini]